MDDLSIDGKTAEEIINLVDLKNENTHRILYGSANIPNELSRAWLSNKKIDEIIKHYPQSQIKAILRRVINVNLDSTCLHIKFTKTETKTEEFELSIKRK